VDDGAETLESAIEALKLFRDSGVRRVVTTPHLDAGHVDSPRRGRIDGAFGQLAAAAAAEVPEIELGLSYEIRIDDPEVSLADRSLGLAGGGALLVEFPQLSLPAYSDRMLEIVADQDWKPVLAHPERYTGISQAYGWIERWRDMGVVMCVNVGSLFGEHGREAEQVVRRMLAAGHADVMGSDHHARPNRSTLLRTGFDTFAAEADPTFEEVAGYLMWTNPKALLEGEVLSPVPPIEFSDGWFSRLGRKLRGG
jgi:tyrosine-protein phosphatase YwqE